MNARPLQLQARIASSAAFVRSAPGRPMLGRLLALALAATFGAYGLSSPSQGQSPAKAAPAEVGLEGSWSGGGSVVFAGGSREKARCRAYYQRASKDRYRLQATCATASGKANQVAVVRRVGDNKYSGTFHNPDFDISGTIFVIVNGNKQNVRLTSSSGWALLHLSR
jgi:hypothetical protein